LSIFIMLMLRNSFVLFNPVCIIISWSYLFSLELILVISWLDVLYYFFILIIRSSQFLAFFLNCIIFDFLSFILIFILIWASKFSFFYSSWNKINFLYILSTLKSCNQYFTFPFNSNFLILNLHFFNSSSSLNCSYT